MKMAKRALAVVLSLVMAFSAFSIVGSAAMNTSKVFEGNDNTLTQGIDIFKVVDGTPVETELASGSNLEPGDVIEVRVKIGTDFYAQSVSSHICYDSTIFTPYKDGAVYTTVDTVNFGKSTNFFKTYEGDVETSDGLTWYQTLLPDDKLGRSGAVNTFSAAATTAQKNVARIQYTPISWKQGGKASGAILADYVNYHFVSVKFGSGTDAEAAGTLIKVPYDTYFSFQLQVLDSAATADGATTSVWIPFDAVKSLSTQSSNKVTAEAVATNEYTATTSAVVGYGHTVDLTDGEVEFTIGKGAVEPEPDPEPTMYTVTFAAGANGSLTGETSVTVEEGTAFADIALPTAVADAGYKFAGWTGAPETITADVTVTANFEYDASQYATVTFAAGDNGSIVSTTESVTVLKGTDASEISFPEAIADAGYKFTGWDLTGAINADVTATATFEYDAAQWATVTFAAGANGTIAAAEAVTVLKGTDASEISFPEATADAGYKFAGWDLTGAITANVTATATFVVDDSQYATVTFVAGANGTLEGETTVTVLKGTSWDAITFPTAKANAGYAFAGWDNKGTTVDADVTVTASFESTEAIVTVNVYTMDTTGAYGNPAISTFSATIGAEASVDAADYESEGFYVDTDKSLLAVESVAAEGATLNVYVARTVATYTFLVPDMDDDDTFTQYDQDEYYYGATIVLPIDPSVDGYEFKGWMTEDGANFTGGTAGTEDVTVTASFDKIDTSLTDEDLAALTAATTALPDPENLYFYTDEAILSVAAALGSAETDADAYIATAIENGYAYEGAMTKAAVNAAAAAIAEIATNINVWVDGKMPNRDESKANIDIKVIPSAINGEEVTPDADNKVVINEGDIVSFDFILDTDYYLSALYAQVLYDTDLFDLVDVDDYVYTQEDIEAGEAYAEYILETTTDRNISRNYDIACESVESFAKQYHASVKNDADFMAQYKIILISVVTKAQTNSKAMKFDDAYIATFRLKATEDVVYDGSIESLVGVNADWYADADNKSELLAGTRGTGYKADGTTVANAATNNKYSWSLYDNFAQYGQTFTSTLANVQFGEGAAPVAQYTVTFAAGDNGSLEGETSVTVDEGTAFADITLPEAVADAGYKFAGWTGAPETITADVTVTANFEYDAAQWATVTFAAGDNGNIADAEAVTVLKGTDASEIEFPEVKADAGYKFAGWDLTGAITADVTATANFEYDVAQWATVTFAAGANGTIADAEAVTVLKGTDASEIAFPEATADAGYKFVGWDLTGAITVDVTATANFEYDASQYATVTFAAGANGTIADAEAVTVLKGTDASEIEFPEATANAGYKFAGWDLTGAITADVTATANFEYDAAQWATVTFVAGANGSIEGEETVTVLKGTSWGEITFPEAVADAGYEFAGWDNEGNGVDADVTVTASFEKIEVEITADVLWAGYEVNADGTDADAETIYVIAKKDALKLQIRNTAEGSSLTYSRTHTSVVSIEAIEYLGVDCELWAINRALAPATFIAVAKYADSDSIDNISAELGYEFEVIAETPEYDDAVYSAKIENAGEYDGVTEQTIIIETGLDVSKIQLLNNDDNGTMTYGRIHQNVTVEEVDGKLVWTINKIFAVGKYSYSILAKSVAGWADSDIDLDFEITAKIPENNAPVVEITVDNGVPTATVKTSANVRKVKFTNTANNSTFTYAKTNANVTVETTADGLTWTITLPTHSANTFNYNVTALLGSAYSAATPVTFTVTK